VLPVTVFRYVTVGNGPVSLYEKRNNLIINDGDHRYQPLSHRSLSKFDVKNAISFLSFDKGSIVFGTANGNLNKVCYSEEDDFRDQSVL